jgi:hypothetical protein
MTIIAMVIEFLAILFAAYVICQIQQITHVKKPQPWTGQGYVAI